MVKVWKLILNYVHLNGHEAIVIDCVHGEEVLLMEKNVAKGPTLANGALLVAQDCQRALFAANQLSCFDMDIIFDLQLLEQTQTSCSFSQAVI